MISDYPQTDSVPAAYYKLGTQTYKQLKQTDLARKAFETVMQSYPESRGDARQAGARSTREVDSVRASLKLGESKPASLDRAGELSAAGRH